nr:hypothetical transcript [Hymenolepis microstoma]
MRGLLIGGWLGRLAFMTAISMYAEPEEFRKPRFNEEEMAEEQGNESDFSPGIRLAAAAGPTKEAVKNSTEGVEMKDNNDYAVTGKLFREKNTLGTASMQTYR